MHKLYDDLTGEQKIKVTKMYADLSTLRRFMYKFDEDGHYHGRDLIKENKEPEPPKEQPKRKRRTNKK